MALRPRPLPAYAAVGLCLAALSPATLAGQETSEREDEKLGVLVEGTVVDHDNGSPLPGATVSLGAGPSGVRGRGTRVTDDEGRFSFEDVPEGVYMLFVSAQAYRDMRDSVEVATDGDVDLILPLSKDPIRLEPIIVTARKSPMAERAYERRRRAGSPGILITREEIVERNPRFISELLHRVHGGMVVPTPPHGYTLLLRGQCRPGIWLDGVEATGATSIDQLITPMNIEAIEVYHGFELPVEYGVNACGGILIWTRRGPSPSDSGSGGPSGGFLSQLVRAAVVVLVVVLVTR